MNTNVYNIVWADDEVDALLDRYKERFQDNGFQIIGVAHDGKELEVKIAELASKTDAVIVDANFPSTSLDDEFSERNISGLDYAYSLYAFSYKRSIPFFVFTQRSDELLEVKFEDKPDFRSEFKRHKNWFKKNDDKELKDLFKAIKDEVEYRRSDAFIVRNKYRKEFEAAKLIDDAETNLEKGLLFLYDDNTWKDTQDYFNPARKIVERMVTKCIGMKILPPQTSLNNASKLFSGMVNDCHEGLKETVMPRPLAESLFHFLKITQDGSHDANDMGLGVDKYVRDSKNINLYRSILYIAMDLLLWYKDVEKKYKGNVSPLWEEKFIYEGKVSKGLDNRYREYFYVDHFELAPLNDSRLKAGAMVRIYDSEPNKHPKGQQSEFVKKENFRVV